MNRKHEIGSTEKGKCYGINCLQQSTGTWKKQDVILGNGTIVENCLCLVCNTCSTPMEVELIESNEELNNQFPELESVLSVVYDYHCEQMSDIGILQLAEDDCYWESEYSSKVLSNMVDALRKINVRRNCSPEGLSITLSSPTNYSYLRIKDGRSNDKKWSCSGFNMKERYLGAEQLETEAMMLLAAAYEMRQREDDFDPERAG